MGSGSLLVVAVTLVFAVIGTAVAAILVAALIVRVGRRKRRRFRRS